MQIIHRISMKLRRSTVLQLSLSKFKIFCKTFTRFENLARIVHKESVSDNQNTDIIKTDLKQTALLYLQGYSVDNWTLDMSENEYHDMKS